MNRRLAFLRRQPAALIAAAEERLAFLENDFGFERSDLVSEVGGSDRHPDIGRTKDTLLAWRRDEEVLKLTRRTVPFQGEAIFLEWFPVVMPMACYLYTAVIEHGTRDMYDRELARMVDELLPDLKTASQLRKERVAD
jgi:hypothetical protein